MTPALLAIALQAVQLNQLIYPGQGLINLGFFTAFSLISWLVCIQILISSLYRPVESLGIAMFPLAGIASLLSVIFPATEAVSGVSSQLIQGHIMISVIAYSLIMLSALQAITLAFQEHAIRSHHPGGFVRFLPPLHDMETLLFQMLGFGFIFLSTALISGFFFVEDLFAQHLVHKTVLSIIGWIILAILLYGRYRFGWRGKLAIRWTLTSFVFIMLAYFGSKLVLEFILTGKS
ncbi:MAG: cytochrome c biogenesis protein CcsA [Gammaproteobacteria bacterium]|nr:cytochrome c biogenesis protein CcsA [Gammaproteobacteria bacterium]